MFAAAESSLAGLKDQAGKTKKRDLVDLSGSQRPYFDAIRTMILEVDARAVGVTDQEFERIRENLAKGIGCSADDLQALVDEIGEAEWAKAVLDTRVRLGLESVELRDASWDSLEAIALRKLQLAVESGDVRDPLQILAIATAANKANRGNRMNANKNGQLPSPGGNHTNINIGLGINQPSPTNGSLPSGDLGFIELNLSARGMRQLKGEVVDGKSERIIDTHKMMTLKEIQVVADEAAIEET